MFGCYQWKKDSHYLSVTETDWLVKINKTIALIYGDEKIQEVLKKERKRLMENWRVLKDRPVKEKPAPTFAIVNEVLRKHRAEMAILVDERKKKMAVKIKKRVEAAKCHCSNIVDHYLRCRHSFLPFNKNEVRTL